MTTDQIHLAVYQDCEACNGSGKVPGRSHRNVEISIPCTRCDRHGKVPIYIPIDELTRESREDPRCVMPVEPVKAIIQWMDDHDAAVDELTAELDASGLVEDVPPKVSRVEDRPRAEALPEGGWPEHPANATAQESLEFGVEQIVANSCPSASMAKMDHAGNPIDDRDERLQGIYAVALDVLVRLRGIGQEPPAQPAKANPKYKPFMLVQPQRDLPEGAWSEHPAKHDHGHGATSCWACARIINADDFRGIDGLGLPRCERCHAEFVNENQPTKAKESPDLAVAARKLVDLLQEVRGQKRWNWTQLNLAIVEVKECLDGRGCALPRPYRVEAILANMDRQANNHGLAIPDTVCLLAALLAENESLAGQVMVSCMGYLDYQTLVGVVDQEMDGDGKIVHRDKPQNMCGPCNGTGEVQGDDGPEVCSGCNGSGAAA